MANRAYLYSADRLHPWPRAGEPYYDSRWTIPLAWFFFYRSTDIHNVEGQSQDSKRQEVKLAAEKGAAIALLKARQTLLRATVTGRIRADAIEAFVKTVEARPGKSLLLDPQEVFDGRAEDQTWHADRLVHILSTLETDHVRPQAVLEAASRYVGSLDPDPNRLLGQIFGYTYWD